MNKKSAKNLMLSEIDPLLVDVKGLAIMLSCSVRKIWRMRSACQLPAPVKLGGRSIRWIRRDIENFIDSLKGGKDKYVS